MLNANDRISMLIFQLTGNDLIKRWRRPHLHPLQRPRRCHSAYHRYETLSVNSALNSVISQINIQSILISITTGCRIAANQHVKRQFQ